MLHVVTADYIGRPRRTFGNALVWGSAAAMALVAGAQTMNALGHVQLGLTDWRPTLYAFLLFSVCLCWGQVLIRGEQGKRALFVLPASLFVLSLSVIPLALGLVLAFSDWNLSSTQNGRFNGLDNIRQMLSDQFFWNALGNMVWYSLAIVPEYVVAFGLALMLNAQIRARKFFRVAFLLPMMLSPVAISWMIGKSMFIIQPAGPVVRLLRSLGFANPTFYTDPWVARLMIMMLDAWTYIPFMMIMLLAGLQSVPREVQEAARVDGASGWRTFWSITFPLTLSVSVTAVLIRLIFKLRLADVVMTLTAGGPGGATDTVSSFIYREYRVRSNVGYGSLLAMAYLFVVVVLMATITSYAHKATRPRT